MKRFVIVPFAVVALAVMLFAAPNVLAQGEAAPAKHTTKVGYLNCHVASGWGFIFGSSRKLQCVFTPAAIGKKIENYNGSITKFGADIGYQQSGVILWTVLESMCDEFGCARTRRFDGAALSIPQQRSEGSRFAAWGLRE